MKQKIKAYLVDFATAMGAMFIIVNAAIFCAAFVFGYLWLLGRGIEWVLK